VGDIKNRINQAWNLRTNQQLEEAIGIYVSLKQEVGLPSGEITKEHLGAPRLTNFAPPTTADIILLGASIARAQRQFSYSEDLIELTESFLSSHDSSHNYHLHFEKGLTNFLNGSYVAAMESFMAAKRLSNDENQKASSLLNSLLCLENLAMPFENTLKELTEMMGDLVNGKFREAIQTQLQAFIARNQFRKGELPELFSLTSDPESFNQAKYFLLWTESLPYHNFHQVLPPPELETLAKNIRFFHQGTYRLRTLQGILHPDDYASVRLSDAVARIYSWTWRWLVSPESFPVNRILLILNKINFAQEAHRLTHEDRQMLRNALLWLTLFAQNSYEDVESRIRVLNNFSKEDYPIYEFEKLMIDLFFAIRDGQSFQAEDFLTGLKSHPLYKNNDLFFKNLIEAVFLNKPIGPQSPLKPLSDHLLALLDRKKSDANYTKSVDLSTYQITDLTTSQSQISQPMTAALKLLNDKKVVSSEEFVSVCFGITNFDPIIHNGKIFNLLSRMRTLFSNELRFGTKSGKVIAEGKWNSICFRQAGLPTEQIIRQKEWWDFINSTNHKRVTSQDCSANEPMSENLPKINSEWFRRIELEALLGVPRSTANRRIKEWTNKKLIKQKGRGRSTQYKLTNTLRRQLFQEGVQS